MKLLIAIVFSATCAPWVEGSNIRSGKRRLENDFYFMYNASYFFRFGGHDDYCLSTYGIGPDSGVQLEELDSSWGECDRFKILDDSTLRPTFDQSKCLQAGNGEEIKDGSVLRLYSCSDSELQKFVLEWKFVEGEFKPFFLPLAAENFCITHQGATAALSAFAILKKCNSLSKLRLGFLENAESPWTFVRSGSGNSTCLFGKGSGPTSRVVLSNNCDPFQISVNTFRPKRYPDICLQAGRGGIPLDGTKLRLFSCNGSYFQEFKWDADGTIRPMADLSLCVVHQGIFSSLQVSIILKKCNAVAPWRVIWIGEVVE